LTIFWLRILTRETVKEVTQGRYEGWVGGGWAEDMEGRSGLTLLLHKPVLSLTLVYIIFFSWFAAASSCAAGGGGGAARAGHWTTPPRDSTTTHRPRPPQVPGYFLFFFPDPKREVTRGTIFWCRIQDHFWCRIRDYFCFVLLTFTY
jgi:hypothetical protein